MHDQVIVSIQDLRYATLFCRHCNTRVSLDLDAEFKAPRMPFRALRECPRCANPFDSAVPTAIEDIQRAYKALVSLGNAVTFTNEASSTPIKERLA